MEEYSTKQFGNISSKKMQGRLGKTVNVIYCSNFIKSGTNSTNH